MKPLILALAATSLLAACAPAPAEDSPSSQTSPDRNPTTPPSNPDSAPPAVRPPDGPSQCRADEFQRYIGRNRSELPSRPANEVWRVTCTTCAVTEDYSPRRLNIFFNEQTQIIEQVRCG